MYTFMKERNNVVKMFCKASIKNLLIQKSLE